MSADPEVGRQCPRPHYRAAEGGLEMLRHTGGRVPQPQRAWCGDVAEVLRDVSPDPVRTWGCGRAAGVQNSYWTVALYRGEGSVARIYTESHTNAHII